MLCGGFIDQKYLSVGCECLDSSKYPKTLMIGQHAHSTQYENLIGCVKNLLYITHFGNSSIAKAVEMTV